MTAPEEKAENTRGGEWWAGGLVTCRISVAAKVTGLGDKRFEGQRVARWHQQHITPLANFRLVSWQPRASEVFYTLPDTIRAEMAIFSPPEEEVQAAVAHLEHLLGDKRPGG